MKKMAAHWYKQMCPNKNLFEVRHIYICMLVSLRPCLPLLMQGSICMWFNVPLSFLRRPAAFFVTHTHSEGRENAMKRQKKDPTLTRHCPRTQTHTTQMCLCILF